MLNSTFANQSNNDFDYNTDIFPLSYDDDGFDSSAIRLNHSFYDDILSNYNSTLNKTNSSNSSPFTFMILIVMSYLILTIILLTFSLYKQRQTEIENFYYGDSDEEIEQGKRLLKWKKYLINKIRKGDMQPLITNQMQDSKTFPLDIV